MKTFTQVLPVTALLASSALAWGPSCGWDDCVGSWNGTSCTSSSGWDCVCASETEIEKMNSCVASSCSDTSDQEAIYAAIAQICANDGKTVTASPEATFSATSGGSVWATQTSGWDGWGPGQSAWSSWVSAFSTAIPGPPGAWTTGSPWGGPGSGWNSKGPWGGSGCTWSTWTGGWGPHSTWNGVWSGCSTATATPQPATVTTTVSGQVITGTTFGVQAVQTAVSTTTISSNDAASVRGIGASTALLFGIVAAVIVL